MGQATNKFKKDIHNILYNGAKKAFDSTYDIEVSDEPTQEEIRDKMTEKFASEFASISEDLVKVINNHLENVTVQHQLTYSGTNAIIGNIKLNTKL